MEDYTIDDLNEAVSFQQFSRVSSILLYVRPNQEDAFGFTPLMIAAQTDSIKMVDLLCNWGAHANYITKRCESAMYIACKYDHHRIVSRLLDRGAYANSKMFCNNTPIFIAVRYSSFRTYTTLIARGANLSHVNADGMSILECARRYLSHNEEGYKCLTDIQGRLGWPPSLSIELIKASS